jgi:hypothetical protein
MFWWYDTGFRRQLRITEGLGFGLTFGTTFRAVVSDVALGTGRAQCVAMFIECVVSRGFAEEVCRKTWGAGLSGRTRRE